MLVTCSILVQLRVHALLHKETVPYYKYVHTAFLNVTQCSSHVKTSDQQFQKGANIRACGVRERVCSNVFKVNQHQACLLYNTFLKAFYLHLDFRNIRNKSDL
jgi:hypothetical protein